MDVLSTAEIRHHVDHGFLQKHNSSSGPDVSYTQSYTSIIRLGLKAGILLILRDNTSGPDDRAARSKCRTTLRGREDYPSTYTKSSEGSPLKKVTPPRVQSIYASLGSKITKDH
ncbi:hypothetical protein F511_10069 [Dorcoceras hygrometricum]|uniref:Uncharacterized protein n=1 Tax=Dorcoceras hygrometricum TaxID=472368 RepID=A0A2Z7A4P6_9LAMI|nr:hypothetical protein F511_10069 [Dorcoceras hygrometricum]